MTPYQALYGQPPPNLLSYTTGSTHNQAVDRLLSNQEQVIQTLKENLQQAQNRMKIYADKRRTEREFTEGDWVYLRLQSYRQKSVAHHHNLKLSSCFYGPFQVLKKIRSVAYQLDLPSTSRIHPTFHVSCLKKKVGTRVQPLSMLPLVDSHGEILPKPKKIIARCMKKVGDRSMTEVLVHWVGIGEEDQSWELLWKLQQLYPHLVDNVL